MGVIATTYPTADAAIAELAARDAQDIERRDIGRERVAVYGRFLNEDAARLAVADLRRRGWPAMQRPADDDPWLAVWRNHTQAVSIGKDRLHVCFPWSELDPGPGMIVEIDPGAGAFGSGGHPTTRLLLEALSERLSGGESVLDVGCGSGVLAIAALRLGAGSATGIDIDPAAIVATRANAEWNGLADRVTASRTPLEDVTGHFDAVLANIHQEPLITLAPHIQRVLAAGGWLGLSGISRAQVSRVSAAFPSVAITATPELDDWTAIIGHRKG